MKKYYLYHQTRVQLQGLVFVFFDKFDTYLDAYNRAKSEAETGLWKVWKIEEVWEF